MGIEIICHTAGRRPVCALFDLDGTLSLLRAGWFDLMRQVMVEAIAEARVAPPGEDTDAWVARFILRTTGKPSLVQMGLLCDQIAGWGGHATPARELEDLFQQRLALLVGRRRSLLGDCPQARTDLLVPGAVAMLDSLEARGVRMYLASGTLHAEVIQEVQLLGLARYFDGQVCGAGGCDGHSPKEWMVGRILSDGHRGTELISFGDGWVETQLAKRAGGTAVGVASDERQRGGAADPHKRAMLIEAGADVVIPDYAQGDAIVSLFWPD